jgi:hypothetical protein
MENTSWTELLENCTKILTSLKENLSKLGTLYSSQDTSPTYDQFCQIVSKDLRKLKLQTNYLEDFLDKEQKTEKLDDKEFASRCVVIGNLRREISQLEQQFEYTKIRIAK